MCVCVCVSSPSYIIFQRPLLLEKTEMHKKIDRLIDR